MVASNSSILEVPLNNNTESLELDLTEFCGGEGSVEEIVGIFVQEKLAAKFWTRAAMEYWRRDLKDDAISLANQGIQALRDQGRPDECLPLLCQLVTFVICLARDMPSLKLEAPCYDIISPMQLTKEEFLQKATHYMNDAIAINSRDILVLDAHANLLLAKKDYEQAFNICEITLKERPTHIYALLGKARVFFHRKHFRPALKIYQQVLTIAPRMLPDPRIGIGSCFWFLGDKRTARRAWERSIVVNPGKASYGARLLLGLSQFHLSRDAYLSNEAKLAAYQSAISNVQTVFKMNHNTASAASILASYFLTTSNWATATKMAERAVQYADNGPSLIEARLVLARAFHAQGKLSEALKEYQAAASLDRSSLNPVLGAAQILVARNDFGIAINTFENVIRRQPQCIEALVNLAALRTHLAFTSSSSTESNTERGKAKELYEQITRLFTTRVKVNPQDPDEEGVMPPRIREVASDPDLYIEIARLSSDSNINRALKAYRQSLTVRQDLGKPIPAMLLNNIGVLEWKNGCLAEAQERIESALAATASAVVGDETEREINERTAVCMLYNLGVICEESSEKAKAKDIYERILLRHPEYVDAKARLSLMYLSERNFDKTNSLLKEALTSQTGNGELRALYTYFLIESNQLKQARDFAVATLKDHDKQDIYALCASGTLLYTQARENKQQGPEAAFDRASKFFRSTEFFEKALQLDPQCAFAAHGLAIALAEHALGPGGPAAYNANPISSASESSVLRVKNLRDSITILNKVREALNDGSVYVNLGHCHYLRDEFERSIENYSTASRRFYRGKNAQVLLYLARAWYQKASKDKSFLSLRNALNCAQEARELHNRDSAIAFNVALIQQKSLELLLDLPPPRRTLADIKLAIEDTQTAQKIFGELAAQKPGSVAFDTDIAHQRKKYGESLLRRTAELLETQQAYESTEAAKVEMARQEREAERQKIAEAERERQLDLAAKNEELSRKRQEMLDSAATWYVRQNSDAESDVDYAKKKKRNSSVKRKNKETGIMIVPDGEGEGTSEGEEKKRKRKRIKKQKERGEDQLTHSNQGGIAGEDENYDSDDGPVRNNKKKPGKVYKSAEFVEDDSE
ncbi:pol II transcription elongation factor [Phakopsora pachyrhizi]|uniref:Pol II transcription elongation factor n=1 Tax=Phakopsora pachyrhizi TaxID=170000 RepID=A0AAV0AQG0_PHAPC|nr:pol II transcription elongation factor [Phakopsora pachyrhizi]